MPLEEAQMLQDEDDDLPPTDKDKIIICEQIMQLIKRSGRGHQSKKVGLIRLRRLLAA